jgi:hypothetical protein
MPRCVTHTLLFSSLRSHFNSNFGVLLRAGRVRMVYLFSLRVVLRLSSRFTASALVWFSNFHKCLVFHFFISLSTVFMCRSSWIMCLFMY